MFVGFKPEPICQERVCNARKKKNAKKKRIDNGLTHMGGSCLGGGGVHLFSGDGFTQSSSLFSSSTTPKPCHSCFRFKAMDTDKPPPLEIKAFFFVSSFQLLNSTTLALLSLGQLPGDLPTTMRTSLLACECQTSLCKASANQLHCLFPQMM